MNHLNKIILYAMACVIAITFTCIAVPACAPSVVDKDFAGVVEKHDATIDKAVDSGSEDLSIKLIGHIPEHGCDVYLLQRGVLGKEHVTTICPPGVAASSSGAHASGSTSFVSSNVASLPVPTPAVPVSDPPVSPPARAVAPQAPATKTVEQ